MIFSYKLITAASSLPVASILSSLVRLSSISWHLEITELSSLIADNLVLDNEEIVVEMSVRY